MKNIKVSVVIPFYNTEKYIENCINSVQCQSYENLEIILVNDGSTDNSEKIVRELMKNDERIKLYNEKHAGVSFTKNAGLNKVNGEYVIFVDSDDWIEKELVYEIVKKIEETEASIIYYDYVMENEKGKILSKSSFYKYKNETIEHIIEMNITGEFPCGATHKAVKYELINSTGAKFTNGLKQGEEFEYTIKAILEKPKIAFVEREVYYHYLQRQGSQSRKGEQDFKENINVLEEILSEKNLIKKYYEEYQVKIVSFLTVEIYRASINNKIIKSIEKMKKINKEYHERYNLENLKIDKCSIRTKYIYILIKMKCFLILSTILKMYNLIKNNKIGI